MNDIIGMIVALLCIGLALGVYKMGWWHGYQTAQKECMEALSMQRCKNWFRLMEERERKEEANGKR